MKVDAKRATKHAVLLIDAMVYIVVIAIVLGLAASLFDKGLRESARLQRNVADIERALKAGERWRADVRAAVGPIELNDHLLAIPQLDGEVIYEFTTNMVRRTAHSKMSEVFLARVQSSTMIEERRGDVVGWRWEIELQRQLKEARVRPLFTFIAVPGGSR